MKNPHVESMEGHVLLLKSIKINLREWNKNHIGNLSNNYKQIVN